MWSCCSIKGPATCSPSVRTQLIAVFLNSSETDFGLQAESGSKDQCYTHDWSSNGPANHTCSHCCSW